MSNNQDVLERFRRGGELVATSILGCAGQEADFKPAPDRWSVRQIVCHLSDTEMVFAVRYRLTLAEDKPTLTPFDQNLWADNLDYGKRKISQAIEMLRRLRTENFELLKDLPETALERTANHVERGVLTLGTMIEQQAAHLENHVRQIQTVRAAYKEHRAKLAAAQTQ
jgi:DinB superfamily